MLTFEYDKLIRNEVETTIGILDTCYSLDEEWNWVVSTGHFIDGVTTPINKLVKVFQKDENGLIGIQNIVRRIKGSGDPKTVKFKRI